jgi:hypothetical protein
MVELFTYRLLRNTARPAMSSYRPQDGFIVNNPLLFRLHQYLTKMRLRQ